ncbi:hypothetical protein [Nitrosopumilus sp.]|uniref:hypothetical protein n=1 Tax=Nitrosopumilus sp. TaxID=2024843 RepID=UPI003D10C883
MEQQYVQCNKCKESKIIDEFRIINTKFAGFMPVPTCIKCENESETKYKERYRLDTCKAKIKLLKIMGGKCVCCGLTQWWILTIDHIKPVKKDKRIDSRSLMFKLLKNPEMRKDFQVMCYGCNNSKNTGEKCNFDHNLC